MVLSAIFWFALLSFLCGSIIRIIRYAKMPPHLRWELYPAGSPKLTGEGSYLEQQEWWNRPFHRSRIAELRFMAEEMFLFHKCHKNNRAVWRFTLPFHWGLFLLTGWLAIGLAGSGAAFLLEVTGHATVLPDGAVRLASPLAMAGLVLTAYGCIGLLLKRLLDPAMRSVTSRGDFFGLSLILATALCWLVSWGLFDRSLSDMTGCLRALIFFAPLAGVNPLMVAGTVLFSLFLVYMPSTYMAHAFAKYFIYHKVVWQDEPMAPGCEAERRIERMLERPVGWSASHITEGGSWGNTISSP